MRDNLIPSESDDRMQDRKRESAEFVAAEAEVYLRRVPLPLDGNERFPWRLAAVLLALGACRGGRASIEQLHTLVWAMNDPLNAKRLEETWLDDGVHAPLRGYVGGLLETLQVAQAEGLIEQAANGSQKLTAKGRSVVDAIAEEGISLGVGHELVKGYAPINATEMWRRLGRTK